MEQSSRAMNDGINRKDLYGKSKDSLEKRNTNKIIGSSEFSFHAEKIARILEAAELSKSGQNKDSERE